MTTEGDTRPRSPATLGVIAAILAKDLRVELRTLQSVPAMVLFSTTIYVIFRFGLDRTRLEGSLAAGVLLVTILFAALLAINRIFVAEREQGGFDAIRLAPVDGTALFFAKAAALLVYLAVLELFALPVFWLFFLDSGSGLLPLDPRSSSLLNLALAVIGALISSIATNSRARDLIGPLHPAAAAGPGDDRRRGRRRAAAGRRRPVYDEYRNWLAVLALLRCDLPADRLWRLRLPHRGLSARARSKEHRST